MPLEWHKCLQPESTISNIATRLKLWHAVLSRHHGFLHLACCLKTFSAQLYRPSASPSARATAVVVTDSSGAFSSRVTVL